MEGKVAANTAMVKRLLLQSPTALGIPAEEMVFYFTIITVNNGRELWRSNGTDANAFMIEYFALRFFMMRALNNLHRRQAVFF